MSKKYIGISGVARAGKNLFCDISKNILAEKYNLKCSSYSLAFYLKQDCEQFVKEKLGLNVFSEKTEDKAIFRELLVWYGDVKRKQSNGRYWTEKLQSDLEKDDSDVTFITDIRYNHYTQDEVYWIQNILKGTLIHVSKYTYGFPSDGRRIRPDFANSTAKIYTEPANLHESTNDPKVKAKADVRFEWQHLAVEGQSYNEIVRNPQLVKEVSQVYENLLT